MAGRRRGRTGRGWDAAPRRRRAAGPTESVDESAAEPSDDSPDGPELARQICLKLLAVRPRTRAELAKALRRRGIADEVAAEVLDRYHEVGMIDDSAFARAWVSSRHHSRGLARRALGNELRQRGVASETVAEALDELDQDTEAATARALVDRKLRTATGPPETLYRRLVGMLARKGYPAGLAFRVVRDALVADERTAELADHLDPDVLSDVASEPDI